MTDPYLSVTSAGGTMQTNEIAATGVGVEVKAGITGLGLPPVELQFDQAIGDGARFRGSRVLQRSIDLRFNVYGPTRDDLKSDLDRLSRILAHPVTLTFHDPDADEEWSITGYRSGGGDYAYGDTAGEGGSDGKTWCNIAVTLVTESPYWEAAEALTATTGDSATLSTPNPGTKAAIPVWTVRGPTLGFKAVSPEGDVLELPGFIGHGTTLTVDCGPGTVVDNHGANRYAELAPLPRFWHIAEGTEEAVVTVDQESDEYLDMFGGGRRNHVTNPNFRDNDNGWTGNGFVYNDTNNRLAQTATVLEAGRANRPMTKIEVTGLTPGENYVAKIRGNITPGKYGAGARRVHSRLAVLDGGVLKSKTFKKIQAGENYSLEFTADSSTVTLRFTPDHAVTKAGKFQRSTGYLSEVYVGEHGAYFDGDTTDTASTIYAWDGTPGASQSTSTPTAALVEAEVTVSYKPRKWLVI